MSYSLGVCRNHKVMGLNSAQSCRIYCFCQKPACLVLSELGQHSSQHHPSALAAAMEYAPTTDLFKVWVRRFAATFTKQAKTFVATCALVTTSYRPTLFWTADSVSFFWKSSRYYCNFFHMDREDALREPIDQLALSFRNSLPLRDFVSL
jgi:hypothetical protein